MLRRLEGRGGGKPTIRSRVDISKTNICLLYSFKGKRFRQDSTCSLRAILPTPPSQSSFSFSPSAPPPSPTHFAHFLIPLLYSVMANAFHSPLLPLLFWTLRIRLHRSELFKPLLSVQSCSYRPRSRLPANARTSDEPCLTQKLCTPWHTLLAKHARGIQPQSPSPCSPASSQTLRLLLPKTYDALVPVIPGRPFDLLCSHCTRRFPDSCLFKRNRKQLLRPATVQRLHSSRTEESNKQKHRR